MQQDGYGPYLGTSSASLTSVRKTLWSRDATNSRRGCGIFYEGENRCNELYFLKNKNIFKSVF